MQLNGSRGMDQESGSLGRPASATVYLQHLKFSKILALFNFTELVHGSFSGVTGGRAKSFQEVTRMGDPLGPS